MRIASALVAALIAVSTREATAQYVIPPTSPLASAAIPLPSEASLLTPGPRDSSALATLRELGEVSLARHLGIGAVIGGVAGYFIGGAMAGDGAYPYDGKAVGRAFGVATGIAAGAIVGAVVWGVRRKPRIDQQPSPYDPQHPEHQRR